MTQKSTQTVNKYRAGASINHDVDKSKTDIVAIATQMILNDVPDAQITGGEVTGIGPVRDDHAESTVTIEFVLGESQHPNPRELEQGDANYLEKVDEVDLDEL